MEAFSATSEALPSRPYGRPSVVRNAGYSRPLVHPGPSPPTPSRAPQTWMQELYPESFFPQTGTCTLG